MQIKQSENQLKYWLALTLAPQLRNSLMLKLIKQFCSIEEIFTAPLELLFPKIQPQTLAYIKNPDWKAVEKNLLWLNENEKHHILTINDQNYPQLLREIASPPPVLFLKGDPSWLKQLQIAIVGSRHPSPAGSEIAKLFASELSAQEFCITSGLALGIDTAAHEASLAANQGTVAVMGTGLDQIYPRKNRALADQILENGLLLSEFPLSVPAKPENFPRRNRIISGLSVGTLVIEATLKSGSLITAKCAAEQGREVFAVPGSIFSERSRGCHLLIREGAKLVETTMDILEELSVFKGFLPSIQISTKTKVQQNKLDEAHLKLLECVGFEPTGIEKIVQRRGLPASKVTADLIELELLGYIQYSLGGYSRVHP